MTYRDEGAMRLLPMLQKSRSLAHSGDNLFTHLVGTWSLLTAWGAPATVSDAGLAHSVYSTSFFREALFSIDQRIMLRRLIGQPAERLVFLFCVLDRAALWAKITELGEIPNHLIVSRHDSKRPLRLSKKTLQEIFLIESANLAEQTTSDSGGPAPWMTRVTFWLALVDFKLPGLAVAPRTISGKAELNAISKYSAALHLPTRGAMDKLSQAAALNPFAAEPRILRGLLALEQGGVDRALVDATRGLALLSAWSTPWDKRLSLATWREVASAIIGEATSERRRRSKVSMFAAVRKMILHRDFEGRRRALIARF